ncbi:MAG TPA: type IX secretion system outer membrane channel protein PorV [Bacteroidota bacterium]|nr:type IX secretion system outer membrane channel protein PorV [Bacteroidota bacterium]
MKKLIFGIVMLMGLMLASDSVHAQGNTAVPFLLISPNSRASGMGESGTGVADDAAALFWNPAGLAFQKGSEVSLSHAKWLPQFNLSDLFYEYLNFKTSIEDFGTVGASVTYLNLGEFIQTSDQGPEEIGRFKAFEVAATAGVGVKISEDWGLGVNLRFINSRLSPIGTANEKGDGVAYNVSGDIAAMYKPKHMVLPFTDIDAGNHFSFGANISNIGPKVVYIDAAQADPLPTQLRVGVGIIPFEDEYNKFLVSVDFSKLLVYRDSTGSDPLPKAMWTSFTKPSFNNVMRSINTSLGLEYTYNKWIALRAGYYFEDPSFGNRNFMTFGAGIKYDIYGFDFSYISAKDEQSPLSDTLRFTLLVLWGE